MKWPFPRLNLFEWIQLAKETLVRYPLMIASGLLSFAVYFYIIEYEKELIPEEINRYLNIALTLSLGIGTFFLTDITVQFRQFNKHIRWFWYGVNLLFLLSVYWSLPQVEHQTFIRSAPYIRFAMWAIIIHLLIAYLPVWKENDFTLWKFNLQMFIRFIVTFLYAYIILIGIWFAIFLIDFLQIIDISDETYLQWFLFNTFVLTPWIFAAGAPTRETIEQYEFPELLKKLCLYVLLPLLGIYTLILYVYTLKILITWEWPRGGIAQMILIVATSGILLFSLLYGVINNKQSPLHRFERWYYILLLPLLAVFYIALKMRIDMYGFTIFRLALLYLNIWLFFISLYKLWKPEYLKILPLSLSIVLFLMSLGPLNVFKWSEKNQIHRLTSILEQNGLLKHGKIINELKWQDVIKTEWQKGKDSLFNLNCINRNLLSDSLTREVYMILSYLDKNIGFQGIQKFFQQNLDSLIHEEAKRTSPLNETDIYLNTMGLCYSNIYWDKPPSNGKEVRFYSTDKPHVKNIKGYDYLFTISLNNWQGKDSLYADSSLKFYVELSKTKPELQITALQNQQVITNIHISLVEKIQELLKAYRYSSITYEIPNDKMQIETNENNTNVKVDIKEIIIHQSRDSTLINFLIADVYIGGFHNTKSH